MENAPAPDTSEADKLANAKRRVAALKGFYIHLFVFAAVLLGLALINAATDGVWWVQWVVLGWGIGILAHAIFVFAGGSKFVADWERRKMRELVDRK